MSSKVIWYRKPANNAFRMITKRNKAVLFSCNTSTFSGDTWTIYQDRFNGQEFDDIDGSLDDLNKAPVVYVLKTKHESFLGPNPDKLIVFAKKKRDAIIMERLIYTCLVIVVSIVFASLMLM